MKNIALFSSSAGSTFEYIYQQSIKTDLVNVSVLISNNKNCGAVLKAKQLKCPVEIINPAQFTELQQWDEAVVNALKAFNIELIVLVGYLKKIGPELIKNYKIINTHPSLLPKYGGKGMYGHHIHKKVFENKDTQTGVSVHYVNSNYDDGQIIAQEKIKLTDLDTPSSIEEKVKAIEKPLLWKTLTQLLQ